MNSIKIIIFENFSTEKRKINNANSNNNNTDKLNEFGPISRIYYKSRGKSINKQALKWIQIWIRFNICAALPVGKIIIIRDKNLHEFWRTLSFKHFLRPGNVIVLIICCSANSLCADLIYSAQYHISFDFHLFESPCKILHNKRIK